MKKIIKILILLLIIALIGILVWMFFFKKDKNVENIDSGYALQIAKEKYENLLNYAEANYMEVSGYDENKQIYSWNNETYLKINDYDNTIKNDVADEFIEKYNNIAQIVQKDGMYYINIKSVDREKDSTYNSTQLIVTNTSNQEIICEAQSTYNNYSNNENNTISRRFVLKNIDGTWKVTEFELPY